MQRTGELRRRCGNPEGGGHPPAVWPRLFSFWEEKGRERPQQVEAGRVKSAWGPGRGLGDAGQLGAVGALRNPEPVSPPVNGVQTALAWGRGGASRARCGPQEGTSRCGWLPALTLPHPWAGALGKTGPRAVRECPGVSHSCPVTGLSMLRQPPGRIAHAAVGSEAITEHLLHARHWR